MQSEMHAKLYDGGERWAGENGATLAAQLKAVGRMAIREQDDGSLRSRLEDTAKA